MHGSPETSMEEKVNGQGNRVIHATSVALEGSGVLILGASGQGKSGLALRLMALGAMLISDDRTLLRRIGEDLWAECPAEALLGLIEARGVGVLRAKPAGPAPIALVIDMDQAETDRLPPHRKVELLGKSLPVLHKSETDHFAAAILQYLRGGRAG